MSFGNGDFAKATQLPSDNVKIQTQDSLTTNADHYKYVMLHY